jgi:cytochrome c peroxidase
MIIRTRVLGPSLLLCITCVALGLSSGLLLRPGATSAHAASSQGAAPQVTAPNDAGFARTIHADGGAVMDPSNPFFQSLGSNGRACISCHMPSENMTITPAGVQARFNRTDGQDPIFRPNDGSNAPNLDVSTVQARRQAYSMLLTKAVIRVGIGIPPNAEFRLVEVNDPYGYASAAELSLFRRPLPATNLPFLTTVMWDGRENVIPPNTPANLDLDFAHQANDATLGHAAAAKSLSDAQRQAIVAYETALYTAQVHDNTASDLTARGASGGPDMLAAQLFYFGTNDVLGADPTGAQFTPVVMTDFDAWKDVSGGGINDARRAVARGQALFNTKQFTIAGVGGLNDQFFGGQAIVGTCTVCHDTPNVGNHSVPAPLNLGIAAPQPPGLNVSGMPLYTLQHITTNATVTVTDPGRALITGKWEDIGKFKGPVLRGLAGRAPYFHNGSAASLDAVVNFYDVRFTIGLTGQEKADLIAFLRSL